MGQGSIFLIGWLLQLRLCGMQGWKEEHLRHMSIIGKMTCFMVILKQNSVALSTAEAEYISTGSCCAQVLLMKATLSDFGIKFKKVPLLCDNESAIKLTNNPIQHARTKHIDVRHHFIRDHQQKGTFALRVRAPMINSLIFSPRHWWEEVWQSKEWIEHTRLLKYVLMHPHFMTCLSHKQSKVNLIDMSFIHC